MRFDEAVQYLLSLGHETLTIKLGLSNTERLLAALGDPQHSFPSVQIAGTNGKGSTAVMLDASLRAAGVCTGLYTSPHLVSITERIRVSGEQIAPERFASAVAKVREASLRVRDESGALPTFFEQVTAAALVAFRDAGVELVILETGLGGRLDATTAARATTVAITPVALDHQEYLGETLAQIAAEKAAIIRPGVVAIIAPQSPEVEGVIRRRCHECGVRPRLVPLEAGFIEPQRDGSLIVAFKTEHSVYENVRLALRGRHQLTNAVVAAMLAESLRERGLHIPQAAIIEGLETAHHAGRLEVVDGTPPLLFDGAHNTAGAQALRDYLDEFAHGPLTLVFGAMRDKALDEIAALLFPAAQRLVLTQPRNVRAATPETLSSFVPSALDSSRITLAASAAEALRAAREQTPADGLICVTGSLYLIGEVKSLLMDQQTKA